MDYEATGRSCVGGGGVQQLRGDTGVEVTMLAQKGWCMHELENDNCVIITYIEDSEALYKASFEERG